MFVNIVFLAGIGAIAVPIVLHLIMRQKPKLLEFPALRFIQRRHDLNQRRLQLRHLLLLLLRAGAIAVLALALARPTIKFSHRFGNQEAPVAAALIFDAGPHMQYRRDKKTRLEAAQEFGQWLLEQLPPESQIAVCDSGMAPQSFDADRGLSKDRINRLQIANNPRPLTRIIGEAARLLKKSELQAKEIYVLTDLSRASWPAEDTAYLQDRLKELTGVAIYLIDVGVTDPIDFALGDLTLSHQVVAAGSSVEIQTDITCRGPGGQRQVEVDVLSPEGKLEQVSQPQIKQLGSGETETLDFHVPLRTPGTRQGVVRILGQDSLAADDERYFTVEVRPSWPVLIVAQPPVSESKFYLASALAASGRFKCDTIDYGQLAARTEKSLEEYAAVCLLDPPGMEAGVWQTLTDYAAAGHGVGVFLGRHAQPVEAFNSLAAQQLLPGQLKEQVPREDGDTYLAPQDYQNPILKPFEAFATRSPWSWFPVYRYWRVSDDLNAGRKHDHQVQRRPADALAADDRHGANRRPRVDDDDAVFRPGITPRCMEHAARRYANAGVAVPDPGHPDRLGAGGQQRPAIELLCRRRHCFAAGRRPEPAAGLRALHAQPQEQQDTAAAGKGRTYDQRCGAGGELPGAKRGRAARRPRLQPQSSRAPDGPYTTDREGGNRSFRPLCAADRAEQRAGRAEPGRSPRRPRDLFLADRHGGGTAGNGVYRKQLVL